MGLAEKYLSLTEEDYIGEGEIRMVYKHPNNTVFCVKIPHQETTRDYTFKELLYYKKINKRKVAKTAYSFFSNFKEEVETNLGLGQVFDLVRDDTTNEISKTLEYYLLNNTNVTDDELNKALSVLRHQMINNRVFARDLRARNVCVKIDKNNNVNLVIIDGLGHRDFIPLGDIFHFFAKKKINRTFTKKHFNSIEEQRKYLMRSVKG